jgi:hypothetical protein
LPSKGLRRGPEPVEHGFEEAHGGQLRAEIQRQEQRYAQTVSSMTQERQEALANEAAFTRMARDSSQQLQLKLADAESKIEFLAAFVSTQVPRLANFFFFLQQLLT